VRALLAGTALEPKLTAAQLQLAMAAESRNDVDEAIARYRAIMAVEPDNAIVLNNLAYSLADRKNAAKEALPLAQRAYRLAPSPLFADTLGWVHFKLGDAAAALPYLDRAAKQDPGNVDILVHAATVHAALNNLPQARAYLDAAVKADPKAADRADVKALRDKIKGQAHVA
jgi:Tfp pilus assembly protein PilF